MSNLSTEIALSTALELLEETQRIARVGGWQLDISSNKLLWTAETYRIFDTSPAEFNPTLDDVLDYFLPESQRKIKAAIDAAINHGIEYDLELETYTLKGSRIDVRATCKVILHENRVVSLRGAFYDISESISQQKQIEQHHQRLTVATDACELGVWEYNLPENSLIWDKRMCELYGISAEKFSAHSSFWESAVHPQDKEQSLHALRETIKNKQAFRAEFRIYHPNGNIHWISAKGYPIEDVRGQIVKVIGTNQNIDHLKEYEERIEMSQKFANTGSWEWNFETGDVYWSPMIAKMYGGPESNLSTNHDYFVSALHPDDRQLVDDAVNSCIESGEEYNIQHRIVWPDGSVHWIAAQGNVVRNRQGKPERMLGMAQDITQRKQIEDDLLTQSNIVIHMEEGANLVRVSDQTLVYANPAFEKMFGYEQGEMLGKHISMIDSPADLSTEDLVDAIITELKVSRVWRGEVHHVKKDGTLFWSSATVSTFKHPVYGEVWLSVHSDISERKLMLEKLNYQASHDALTDLISRYEFENRVNRLLSSLSKEPVEHAMCFLDLDQFKVINDTCGHAAGDELLRQLGRLLGDTVRKRDTLARLGGDEFGILMEHCTLEQASRTANDILEVVSEHQFFWDNKPFRIGVSIGLVAITQTSGNFDELLRQVDAACYFAKELGRNRIYTYHPDDTELAVRHGEKQWVGRISQALDEDRFCLYAQAIVSLDNDSHRHYEILLRMLDEKGEIIPPGAFLPAAERYKLIEKLDAWVVSHTCAFLAKHLTFSDQIDFVSINLSGHSLTNEKFLDAILEIFDATGISPNKVCFEITETAAVSNMNSAIKFVKSLREVGCKFALDDFGSGISSFGYLKNLPVDYLKIDGMFVKDIVEDQIDYAMVKSINEIGQVMGMQTIAEFVENDEIKMKLKALGVNYGQGYGLGEPVPLESLL